MSEPQAQSPPSNPAPPGAPEHKPAGKPSQKSMTKAERRELQEKQRAAKAALKAQGIQPGSTAAGSSKAQKSAQAASKKGGSGDAGAAKQGAVATRGDASHGDEASGKRGPRIFTHFGLPKPLGHTVKGDIHPAVVRLGLMFSEFRICGANARCIATLTAFKSVIQDYTTPSHSTLSRHLMTHLSPQITHLVSARPMSVSMGNAIRQLKLEISNSDIDMIEQDAKDLLCQKIDNYIRDRIIYADEVIQDFAGKKIKNGDVILTYARSSVVEKVLLRAKAEGKDFSVIVVDSRPLLEGKALLKSLTSGENPIRCTYALLPALASLLPEVTTVFIGAHSIYSNGAVYSRAGTALVSMMAKQRNVPVVVCCETYKFSDGVLVDAFGKNELAPVRTVQPHGKVPTPVSTPGLEVLNPLYDLTPPKYITAVVTEVGLIPPSSISSIPLALGKSIV
ncbi:translation initiation factor eIF2B delta subunit [Coprinopsis cinerea okayama7|uniref:Translation initiation factor eIF2B subunit delta n=1 Tax=Coprinopsis cinerea (strain Okayama-7 / 130 / ATCC MYA-4618 / FGSC 9003) TaxID=240176 RepID=A8NWG1_COPC7|nr:translation initiation factor eIF2B delta subunit [Coprinopsis cinerea okayama7\|eukprot:XP_001836884.1 translation initiation factor eIF2B delta subunit [Coprinopsis cinerea okayama7\